MPEHGETMEIKIREVSLPVEVPVKPLSRREVKQLEAMLIIGTLFRPEVLQAALNREEIVTWVDSLAVAAAALALEKAGYTVGQIADELGRTEATIRRHLRGETKAGRLVRETYSMILKGELKLAVPIVSPEAEEELKRMQERLGELEKEVSQLRDSLAASQSQLEEMRQKVLRAVERLESAEEAIREAIRALKS